MNAILKVMKNDKTPLLRNQIVLPLLLSPDPDEELAKATQNRVSALTHDITPDLLRTKPDPDVEIRQNQFEQRAAQVNLNKFDQFFLQLSQNKQNQILFYKEMHEM